MKYRNLITNKGTQNITGYKLQLCGSNSHMVKSQCFDKLLKISDYLMKLNVEYNKDVLLSSTEND